MVCPEYLKQILHYCPETGVFTWLPRPITKGVRIDRFGMQAGAVNPQTLHRVIMINRKHYFAHHLAWLYMTGEWPIGLVDHADGQRDNNAWKNLRRATVSQNIANSKKRSDNSTGYKGVSKRPNGHFRARLMVEGKPISLGDYKTAEEAHAAYCAAAKTHFGEFAREA